MRAPGVGRLGAISAIVLVTAAVLPPAPFLMEATTGMNAADAGAALRHLRGVLDGRAAAGAPLPEPLARLAGDRVPLVLTVWRDGGRWRVFQIESRPLGEAIAALGAELERLRPAVADRRERTRLALDCAVAEGWAPEGGILFATSFVEGWTGVSGVVSGRRVYVAPGELIRNARYGSFAPLPAFDPRFRIGLDAGVAARAVAAQAARLGIDDAGGASDLARFWSLTVVEGERLEPLRLLKGTVERPPLTRARLDESVRRGARYLVSSLKPDGLYRYNYAPIQDRVLNDKYNWPRHAGTSYSLALVGRILGNRSYLAAAERALARFESQVGEGPGGTRCLRDGDGCYLGSTALGLLALAEHRAATGSDRFGATARALAGFVAAMQREDGFFFHDWRAGGGIDRAGMKQYASQQAVFSLARYARAFGDERALAAAERGMDYLAGPYWDHFLGTWFFGQEHWSCLAAEELFAVRPKPEYARLCVGIGVNYDRLCHAPGETPFPEDVGGMSITHMFTPHTGGTATAAEAMVSAVILGRATGADVRGVEEQLRWTLAYLEKGQLTPDDAFWLPAPGKALGGVLESQTSVKVRIDNVQHAISAMIRGRDLVF